MPADPSESALPLPFETARGSASPAPLEAEVTGLFDLYRERLLRYMLSLGLSVEDGEEIVQEVFLALFRHLERGKSRRNLRGWIFRVAHNLALKRRSRTRLNFEGLAGDQFPDPGPDPEEQLAGARRQRVLLAVLDALAEQDRRCLFLRAEGLRYREIAQVLDMSLGAVSLSLSRSLARLARAAER